MPLSELNVPPNAKGGIVTIGNFDGVHRGHQQMLREVVRIAERSSVPAVVVTFDPHPLNVLKPELRLPVLSTISNRRTLLRKYGASEVVVLPVTPDLLRMSPQDFFTDVIVGEFAVLGLVEGPDFRFGRDRGGDVRILGSLCQSHDVSLHVIEAVQSADEMISSTRIRRMLQGGDYSAAAELLGHPYQISGVVGKGEARGRTIGFPTANLSDVAVMLPKDGVYAGTTNIQNRRYPVAINIGANPTFADDDQKLECHIIDFSGDLYGETLNVGITARIRDLQRFDAVDELKAAIHADVRQCRELLTA